MRPEHRGLLKAGVWSPVDVPGEPPEPMFVGMEGCLFGESGRYYPNPPNWGEYINPPRPYVGQVAAGDALLAVLPFGAVGGQIFANNVLAFGLRRVKPNQTLEQVATDLGSGLARVLTGSTGANGMMYAYNAKRAFQGGTATDLQSGDTHKANLNLNVPGKGASSNEDQVPLRSAPVVAYRTSKRGRSFQGRTYWPAMLEDAQAGGLLNAGTRSVFGRTIAGLLNFDVNGSPAAAQGTNAFGLGVYSRKLSKAQSTIVFTYAVGAALRTVMGSIRNRQRVNPRT